MNLLQVYIKQKFGSIKEFAKGMNMSFPTALRYMRNPKELSISHAIQLSKITGDELKDVVEVIIWDFDNIKIMNKILEEDDKQINRK
ncbi:hypothetical protein UFOVP386_2 [uncultured Caudovirales phage]|uniref:Uncharacterized protein n=1 Tax=uncultured Caudovirales phage TaxID=2100421 RepID=A0A6J7X8U0_9CAUD|nr:hypothetical protein UFOVP386_2 [uncultured Caudovirales phage]